MKQKYKRLNSLLILLTCFIIGAWLILNSFNENIVYFYSPTELKQKNPTNKIIRVGGLVMSGSIKKHENFLVEFIITDNQNNLTIKYKGMLPNLFRENQGIVAKGELEGGVFIASELLAKHDENYMPKEVANALSKGRCPSCKN
ncbi:MAG: cytochrome c maturation protein CcmE [Pseudomonadota bacterium]